MFTLQQVKLQMSWQMLQIVGKKIAQSVVPVTISLYTVLKVLYCCSCQWPYINHFALFSLKYFFPLPFQTFSSHFISPIIPKFIALICSITLSRKIVSASTPQYIILTQTTSTQANFLPAQHEVVTSTRADQEPVFFTPLSAANIPVAYA